MRDATFVSVPCGWMSELLSLDYRRHACTRLIGVDLDHQALYGARSLAQTRGLGERVALLREDAWALSLRGAADVLTSNGLNIYESDDSRVTALYRGFYEALRPGGRLVASFLTPPPGLCAQSPWRRAAIDQSALALQQLLFMRLIAARWSVYRTHQQTREQLLAAGFADIEFIDDAAAMFPVVVARKKT